MFFLNLEDLEVLLLVVVVRERGGDEGEGVGGCLVQILSFLLSHLTETWQQ